MSFKQTSNPIKCEWSESSYKCNFKGNKLFDLSLITKINVDIFSIIYYIYV